VSFWKEYAGSPKLECYVWFERLLCKCTYYIEIWKYVWGGNRIHIRLLVKKLMRYSHKTTGCSWILCTLKYCACLYCERKCSLKMVTIYIVGGLTDHTAPAITLVYSHCTWQLFVSKVQPLKVRKITTFSANFTKLDKLGRINLINVNFHLQKS
jgi:hypothetical protein